MLNSYKYSLPNDLELSFRSAVEVWNDDKRTSRIWERDASVWTGDDEAEWLGWLDIVQEELGDLAKYRGVKRGY